MKTSVLEPGNERVFEGRRLSPGPARSLPLGHWLPLALDAERQNRKR